MASRFLLCCKVALFLLLFAAWSGCDRHTVNIPNVVGLSRAVAEQLLEDEGLAVSAAEVPSASVSAGNVISQDPLAGTEVERGSEVELSVSLGDGVVFVPDLAGQTLEQAQTALADVGLLLGEVSYALSDSVPEGQIQQQTPGAGVLADVGTSVAVVVSGEGEHVQIPSVTGLSRTEAEQALEEAGLRTGAVTFQSSSSISPNIVIEQNPAAGASVLLGSGVNLVLAREPEDVSVPALLGMTRAQAGEALSAVGLVLGEVVEKPSLLVEAGRVMEQSPSAGIVVLEGTGIDVSLSNGEGDVLVPDLRGCTLDEAEDLLEDSGLSIGEVTSEASETVVLGQVVRHTPMAGASAMFGDSVDLVLSSGQSTVSVPSLVGMSLDAAQAELAGVGLRIGRLYSESSSEPVLSVIAQSPRASVVVAAGSPVNLTLSLGPAIEEPLTGDEDILAPPLAVGVVECGGIGAEAVLDELLIGLAVDVRAAEVAEVKTSVFSQECKIIGHMPDLRILQVRTPVDADLCSLMETFKGASDGVVWCALNQVVEPGAMGIALEELTVGAGFPEAGAGKTLLSSGFSGDHWLDTLDAVTAWGIPIAAEAAVPLGVVDAGLDGTEVLDSDRVLALSYEAGGPVPENGHGTRVMTLAAADGSGLWSYPGLGVAWESPVIFVGHQSPQGVSTVLTASAAIAQAVRKGARVIHVSAEPAAMGSNTLGSEDNFLVFRRRWREAMSSAVGFARRNGALLCFPAGDDGAAMDENHRPDFDINGDLALTFNQAYGVAESGDSHSLRDEDQSWPRDYYAGYYCRITEGTGEGQVRAVASNDGNELVLVQDWDVSPDSSSAYVIDRDLYGTRLSSGDANVVRGDSVYEDDRILPVDSRDSGAAWRAATLTVGASAKQLDDREDIALVAPLITPQAGTLAHVFSTLDMEASLPAGRLAQFSRFGRVTDLVVPGHLIACTADEVFSSTEYATALTTGAAARTWSIDPSLYAAEVRRILVDETRPLPEMEIQVREGILDFGAAAERAERFLPVPAGDKALVRLPYGEEQEIEIEVLVPGGPLSNENLDVIFLVDLTDSFDDDIQVWKVRSLETLEALEEFEISVRAGIATFTQFPYSEYDTHSVPYNLLLPLTGDLSVVRTAINTMVMGFGGDESQLEALYQLATGAGRDLDDDGDFGGFREIEPADTGWLDYSEKFILLATDEALIYREPGAAWDEAVEVLQDKRIRVAGLYQEYAMDTLCALAGETYGVCLPLDTPGGEVAGYMRDAILTQPYYGPIALELVSDPDGFVQEICEPVPGARGQIVTLTATLKGPLRASISTLDYDLMFWVWMNEDEFVLRAPVQVSVPCESCTEGEGEEP